MLFIGCAADSVSKNTTVKYDNYKILSKKYKYLYDIVTQKNNVYVLMGKNNDSNNKSYVFPTIAKIDPITGKEIYKFSLKEKIYAYPYFLKFAKLGNNFIVILQPYNSYQTYLIKINTKGQVIWKKIISDRASSTSKILTLNQKSFIFNTQNFLFKINKNGNIIWKKELKNSSTNIYTIYDKSIILFENQYTDYDGHVELGFLRMREFDENGREFFNYKFKYPFKCQGIIIKQIKILHNGDLLLRGIYQYLYKKPGWVGYSDGEKKFQIKLLRNKKL